MTLPFDKSLSAGFQAQTSLNGVTLALFAILEEFPKHMIISQYFHQVHDNLVDQDFTLAPEFGEIGSMR